MTGTKALMGIIWCLNSILFQKPPGYHTYGDEMISSFGIAEKTRTAEKYEKLNNIEELGAERKTK